MSGDADDEVVVVAAAVAFAEARQSLGRSAEDPWQTCSLRSGPFATPRSVRNTNYAALSIA